MTAGGPPQSDAPIVNAIMLGETGYCLANSGVGMTRDEKTGQWVIAVMMTGGKFTPIVGGFRPVNVKLVELMRLTNEEMAALFAAAEKEAFGPREDGN